MTRYHDGTIAMFGQQPPKPPAHHNAPPGTSAPAARAIEPNAATLRAMVLAHIRETGGCTDDAGQIALGLGPQTYTPRRWELAKQGLVADSGRRAKTSKGRDAAVWCAK